MMINFILFIYSDCDLEQDSENMGVRKTYHRPIMILMIPNQAKISLFDAISS